MQFSMFAKETQLERLSKLGDSLEKLKIIDFESFRPLLEKAFRKDRKSNVQSIIKMQENIGVKCRFLTP